MLLSNMTIAAVDEKNRTLVLGSLARFVDGFVLSFMNRSGFIAARGLNSPFLPVGHNMLISVSLLCRNFLRVDVLYVLESAMRIVNEECST